MRKLSLIQLLKNAVAFGTVSATTADLGLLLAERAGWLEVPGSWYINVPLGIWTLVGVPVSINLAERLVRHIDTRPGRISAMTEDGPSPLLRSITWNSAHGPAKLLLHSTATMFGEEPVAVHRPAAWQVPVGENQVLVREAELLAFLEMCQRRQDNRQQTFSRDYWLYSRRPPLWRGKYEAMMALLTETGLVEGRQGGASGRLVTKAHHALTYLKYESPYAVG